jgi:hypothetical protein
MSEAHSCQSSTSIVCPWLIVCLAPSSKNTSVYGFVCVLVGLSLCLFLSPHLEGLTLDFLYAWADRTSMVISMTFPMDLCASLTIVCVLLFYVSVLLH